VAGFRGGDLPLVAVRHGPTYVTGATMVGLDRILSAYGYAREHCERLGSSTPVTL
jgi:hypothetical protein